MKKNDKASYILALQRGAIELLFVVGNRHLTLKDFAERNQCHQFHLLTRRNPSHRMCHPMERTFLYLHKERAPLRMLFLELSKWNITS